MWTFLCEAAERVKLVPKHFVYDGTNLTSIKLTTVPIQKIWAGLVANVWRIGFKSPRKEDELAEGVDGVEELDGVIDRSQEFLDVLKS